MTILNGVAWKYTFASDACSWFVKHVLQCLRQCFIGTVSTQINLSSNRYPIHIYFDKWGFPEVSFFFDINVVIIISVVSTLPYHSIIILALLGHRVECFSWFSVGIKAIHSIWSKGWPSNYLTVLVNSITKETTTPSVKD